MGFEVVGRLMLEIGVRHILVEGCQRLGIICCLIFIQLKKGGTNVHLECRLSRYKSIWRHSLKEHNLTCYGQNIWHLPSLRYLKQCVKASKIIGLNV